MLGSIANKLIQTLSQIPVCVVGERPGPEKILIGIDGSDNAMKAVDFVGSWFSGTNVEVLLVNVVRGMDQFRLEADHLTFSGYDDLLKEAKKSTSGVFEVVKSRLVNAGLMESKVTVNTVLGAGSRAAALVGKARRCGCGTIVVGRRGLSRVDDFFMGRVSNKVLHLAKEMAVWIVS